MKKSTLIHALILAITISLCLNLLLDFRSAWPIKKIASQTFQRGKVESLRSFLIEVSGMDLKSSFSKDGAPQDNGSSPDGGERLVRHLKRLVASGDAPARLLSDPLNTSWMEVSGLATRIETMHGTLWVGRVSGFHGPIVVFAMNGEVLHVTWDALGAMNFYGERKWMRPEAALPNETARNPEVIIRIKWAEST